jgi:hypothetical protein
MLIERILLSKVVNFCLLKFELVSSASSIFASKTFFTLSKRFFFWKTDNYSDGYWFKYTAKAVAFDVKQIF